MRLAEKWGCCLHKFLRQPGTLVWDSPSLSEKGTTSENQERALKETKNGESEREKKNSRSWEREKGGNHAMVSFFKDSSFLLRSSFLFASNSACALSSQPYRFSNPRASPAVDGAIPSLATHPSATRPLR